MGKNNAKTAILGTVTMVQYKDTVTMEDTPTHTTVLLVITHRKLLLQRDHAMHFVSGNDKSDIQAHSSSLAFVPFDRYI